MVDISEVTQLHRADPLAAGRPRTRMRGGFIGSLALHGLVLALVALSWKNLAAPQSVKVVAVNLVRLSDRSTSPPSLQTAPIPQDKASTVPQSEAAQIALAPIVAPQTQPLPPSAPYSGVMQKPNRETKSPMVVKPASRRSPNEQLAARLKLLAGLRQTARQTTHSSRQQDSTGIANMTATSTDAVPGRYATYAVRDFIRAQVERRWNLDRARLGARDWVVAIRIRFSPDGTVRRADIVDIERFRSDSAYHDFALSARNAVLLSSPLTLPPGTYAFARDIVVDFASRQVLQ